MSIQKPIKIEDVMNALQEEYRDEIRTLLEELIEVRVEDNDWGGYTYVMNTEAFIDRLEDEWMLEKK